MTKTYAFFDVDGTIINFTSAKSFLRYYVETLTVLKRLYLLNRYKLVQLKNRIQYGALNREQLNFAYYQNYRGEALNSLINLGKKWFEGCLDGQSVFNGNVIKHLRFHQEAGHEVVFVSGAFLACLNPIADHLNVKHILCTNLIEKNSLLTGEIKLPQAIGAGKAALIKNFWIDNNTTHDGISAVYAYGDHISDLSMLEMATHPHVISGDPELTSEAIKRNWKIIEP